MTSRWMRTTLFGTALLVSACAGPRRRPESANTARLDDSAAEKRAAAPGLGLEEDEARWGITAAEERKRQRDAKSEQKRNAVSTTDIRATPAIQFAPPPPKP